MQEKTSRTLRSCLRLALVSSVLALSATGCDSTGNRGFKSGNNRPPTGLGNQAPTISGRPPATARVNVLYEFTPSASDPDGDALRFEVQGLPEWASFDASSGRLRGTPTQAERFANVRIAVSDGKRTAALPAFAIDVSDAALLGSATLRWVPPTETSTGAPLTDLAGFRVYYGQSYPTLDRVHPVADRDATQAVIDNLGPGTWYFALTAVTTSGAESSRSNVVTKGI